MCLPKRGRRKLKHVVANDLNSIAGTFNGSGNAFHSPSPLNFARLDDVTIPEGIYSNNDLGPWGEPLRPFANNSFKQSRHCLLTTLGDDLIGASLSKTSSSLGIGAKTDTGTPTLTRP